MNKNPSLLNFVLYRLRGRIRYLSLSFLSIISFFFANIDGYAKEFCVGDNIVITIPSPIGFVELSDTSSDLFNLFKSVVPASEHIIALFITEEDIGKITRGDNAELSRYMTASINDDLKELILSKQQFCEIRSTISKKYDAISQKQRQILDEVISKSSKALSKYLENDVILKIDGNVYLGINQETASLISISKLMKINFSNDGNEGDYIGAETTVLILVKGKVLNITVWHTYASENDINWTRSTAKTWAEQILAANETVLKLDSNEIVPIGTLITTKTKELLKGPKKSFSSKGHSKARGIDISFEYPASWLAEEGDRPHIVQKILGKEDGPISITCMVYIDDIPSELSFHLTDETADIFIDGVQEGSVPAGATILDKGKTFIDGEKSGWLKYYDEKERAGQKLSMYSLQYIFFFTGKMISMSCTVGGAVEDKLILEDAFNSYLPVFQSIANSVVIRNKWNKVHDGKTKRDSDSR